MLEGSDDTPSDPFNTCPNRHCLWLIATIHRDGLIIPT